jgi:hypothetical protein
MKKNFIILLIFIIKIKLIYSYKNNKFTYYPSLKNKINYNDNDNNNNRTLNEEKNLKENKNLNKTKNNDNNILDINKEKNQCKNDKEVIELLNIIKDLRSKLNKKKFINKKTKKNKGNIRNIKVIKAKKVLKELKENKSLVNCKDNNLKNKQKLLKIKSKLNKRSKNSNRKNLINPHNENNKKNKKKFSQIILNKNLCNINNHKIKYLIRIETLKNFFNGIFDGFKSIIPNEKKIIKDGKLFILKEIINGYFMCKNLKKGIKYSELISLKFNLKIFDYRNYRNSAQLLLKLLRRIVGIIGNNCEGLYDIMEFIYSNVIKMRKIQDKDIKKLIIIESFKNKAIEEIKKSSYENAGLYIGRILGYSKLFQL